MAESMKGLKENTPMCGELSSSKYRRDSYHHGMGAEEQK